MHIGVVGGGFVGSATALLECNDIQVTIFDLDPSRCKPVNTKVTDLLNCDITFVCVPTPTYASGACNTTIVEKCIEGLKKIGVQNIVLRSTVPPGTSEKLDVMFMPEFLTEANWKNDFFTCQRWIFGVRNDEEKKLLQNLIDIAHKNNVIQENTTQFVSSKEAELIKYTRNNFLAMKISFFNEIYRLCKTIGADFEHIREGVGSDKRIGISHTLVPGYDGHFGFGGTCLPKDTSALMSFMKENSVECPVVSAIVHRNMNIDRPEHDWENDPRAFTK
jgi:nucleotide sugar dehydrogenase